MLYRTINRNKKSIVLDLQAPRRVGPPSWTSSPSCDVLLENFRPGTLEKWGLGPEVAERGEPRPRDHPHLGVRADRSARRSGPGSPRSPRPWAGLRELVGDPDRPPVRVGVSIGDSIAGLYAAFGAVMALFQREAARKAAGAAGIRPWRSGSSTSPSTNRCCR